MKKEYNTHSTQRFLDHAKDFFQRKIDEIVGYNQCVVSVSSDSYPLQIEIKRNGKQDKPHKIVSLYALLEALNEKSASKVYLATDGKTIQCTSFREDDLCGFARRFFEDFHNDCYDDSYIPLMEMESSCAATSFKIEHPTAFVKHPYKKQFPSLF